MICRFGADQVEGFHPKQKSVVKEITEVFVQAVGVGRHGSVKVTCPMLRCIPEGWADPFVSTFLEIWYLTIQKERGLQLADVESEATHNTKATGGQQGVADGCVTVSVDRNVPKRR